MKLTQFRDVLNSVSPDINVYHEEALKEENQFIVWNENKIKSLYADSECAEFKYSVTVIYITKTEYDETPLEIMQKFDENFIAYGDCKIEHMTGTDTWIYSWEAEV